MHKYNAKYSEILESMLTMKPHLIWYYDMREFHQTAHQHDNCADEYYNNRCAVAELQFLTRIATEKSRNRRRKMKNAGAGHLILIRKHGITALQI